ncbi:alpha-L-fucosidase [Xylella taiwanensis]|uniref:alpha-L-fucosidase n=2 Tax=Xylella taiwanensis TaxID=1444770 RepID=Z9JI29_9GAMM|nr:alpha-L-fucosidase [Xylella taiwanensis]AXI82553.1 alpha-L-fucosidase [Xylella taiwanensis]EWS77658.1 alpha-L-fucosidase [Xylella taiwanensis]MCD8455544.1 alpha-L-fucosidase [Xylella taiwanensis]MCD8460086.1 alpha-L-fucosidase [Xylella taiwanensis]MCD8463855.1 alpha-L-fucosidase [Xylella taiwanensis]
MTHCALFALLRWLVGFSLATVVLPAAIAQNFAAIKPSPQQIAWQDLGFGVIVHFNPNTWLNQEWGDGSATPKVFNPTQVDPGQWARAAKAAGAKYLILVAKHHDGFALWPTAQSEYSIKHSPWMDGKGDLVKLTAEAVRQEGMGFGIYLSPWDRHEPKYSDAHAYNQFYAAQLVELALHYGPITEWWLDGAGSAGHVYDFDKYLEELRTYQPNAMVFADTALFKYGDIRWVGNEAGVIEGENWNVIDRHGDLRWRPIEVDTPLHQLQWFWHPNNEQTLKSVDELIAIWEKSVGLGGQLILGIAPDTRGLLPEADVKRLQEMGAAIQARYGPGKNLVPANLKNQQAIFPAVDGDLDTFWSAPQGSHSAVFELHFKRPITFDTALSMEWINDGQLVQKYVIEVWQQGKWVRVAQAQAIGRMKIDHFASVTASRVRLNILASADAVHIREFQLFNTGNSVAAN